MRHLKTLRAAGLLFLITLLGACAPGGGMPEAAKAQGLTRKDIFAMVAKELAHQATVDSMIEASGATTESGAEIIPRDPLLAGAGWNLRGCEGRPIGFDGKAIDFPARLNYEVRTPEGSFPVDAEKLFPNMRGPEDFLIETHGLEIKELTDLQATAVEYQEGGVTYPAVDLSGTVKYTAYITEGAGGDCMYRPKPETATAQLVLRMVKVSGEWHNVR